MAELESAVANEPIIGWRAWRVYPIDTLRAGTQYRLCAVGTRGVPKVWEPGRATVAVCSAFKSRHEAPDPEHECGLYGLRSRARLDALLEEWVEMGQGQPVAWAVGQVSLWGRVVELELGWRAEFAYPFAITVHTDVETLARALRQLYAVDVEVAAPLKTSPARSAEEEDVRSRLEAIRDGLGEVERTLGAPNRCERTPPPDRSSIRVGKRLGTSSEDDLLRAVLLGYCRKATIVDQYSWAPEEPDKASLYRRESAETKDVVKALRQQQGLLFAPPPGDVTRVASQLQGLVATGYIERATYKRTSRIVHWRLTRPGVDRLEEIGYPDSFRMPVLRARALSGQPGFLWRRAEVVTARYVDELLDHAVSDQDIERDTPSWIVARREAQTRGRRAYRQWLRGWRADSERLSVNRLPFTEEHILAALQEALRLAPKGVSLPKIMDRLAPGKPSRSEISRVGATLAKLGGRGTVRKVGTAPALYVLA